MISNTTDVLVIGGGPAGSTVATILARQGIKTTVLERDVFPRYHIGESLLASLMPMLDAIGAGEKMKKHGFVEKPGGYFNWGNEKWSFRFDEIEGAPNHSYQVKRSEFDKLLLDHAAENGASVHQNVKVSKVEFDNGRAVSASYLDRTSETRGNISFKYLVDCSGRSGVIANEYAKDRHFHNVFKNVAIWSYWSGTDLFYDDLPAGSTRIISVEAGWIWFIPLNDGTVSVGTVITRDQLRKERDAGHSAEQVYDRLLADNEEARIILKDAKRTDIKMETDYSYTSERFSGPGYFMCGDAACFLDPLLSSGVHLAMVSSLVAAASIASILKGHVDEARAVNFFETSYRQAYLRFLMMVSSFYDLNRGQAGYFWEAQRLTSKDYSDRDMKKAFVSIVSGGADYTEVSDGRYGEIVAKQVAEKLRQGVDMRRGTGQIGDETKRENMQFMDALNGLQFLQANAAIDGLYVVTQPEIMLAQTAA
ncbi:NAD(P)/FAD-dependent oxidoreductase [Aminobacter sp. MDW-2]|uniref:NAD(P)/FAD-dependent oxidoreductase n=1 Tax=Aminobacter sp. MDW-2 TaxID=2666139 RepID=UPI0012B02B21|nr:NAD(P)/FAD-dependent oxidoreductase [Aminobacter sp. MDW-2]MRX37136.1 FAD-dependent oxidoreductase [Aminobacter sp. MDW-2]QNH35886.1 tryptophan 7-halogenase [Aminobacter sp. MDW-2]